MSLGTTLTYFINIYLSKPFYLHLLAIEQELAKAQHPFKQFQYTRTLHPFG